MSAVDIALAYLEGLGSVQALQVCHALKVSAEHELRFKTKFLDLTSECGQCLAITKKGTRCSFAGKRSGYCGRHYYKNQEAVSNQYGLLTPQEWQRIVRKASKEIKTPTTPVWTLCTPQQAQQFITPPRSDTNWRQPTPTPVRSRLVSRRALFPATIEEHETTQCSRETTQGDALDALQEMLDHKHNGVPSASRTQVITTITTVNHPQAPVPIPGTCGANGGITLKNLPCRRLAKAGQRCYQHNH